MARERAIQIRVSQEEYDAIKANAGETPIGRFLRDLGMGLSDGNAGTGRSLDPSGPLENQSGAPVAEPRPPVHSASEIKRLAMQRHGHLPLVVAERKVTKELEAQGNPNAEEVARKRLGM